MFGKQVRGAAEVTRGGGVVEKENGSWALGWVGWWCCTRLTEVSW